MAEGIWRQVVTTICPMQVPLDDPAAGGAQGTGRGHVFLFLEGEDLAADDAGHGDPVQKAEGDEHGDEVGAQYVGHIRDEA